MPTRHKRVISEVSELYELYKLSLHIGTSLDLKTNARTFYEPFSKHKNINALSVWSKVNNVIHFRACFPEHKAEETSSKSKQVCNFFKDFEKNKIQRLSEHNQRFIGLEGGFNWAYCYEHVLILFNQDDQYLLNKKEIASLESLLKKFALSMKACISHKASLDEVLKRRKAEFKLYNSESLFRLGANSLCEGIICTDLDGKITYVNKAMSEITGYSNLELLSPIAHELFKPKGIDDFIEEVIEAKRKKGISNTYEIQQVRKDGSLYWVRITASPFKDHKGKIVGTIASMLDITDILNAQREMKKSQSELQELVDTMYDGVIILDSNGVFLDANNAALKLFEIEKDQLGTLNLSELVPEEERIKLKPNRIKVMQNGGLSTFVSKVITPTGKTRVVEVSSSAIVKDNVYVGSRDVVRDITDKVKIRQAQELSEKKLHLIIDTALDAVVTMNEEGNIIEWNKNAERIFGYEASVVVGNKLSEFIIPHKYREAHERGMKHYFATGEGPVLNSRIEITAIDKNEREFPIELSITPLKQGEHIFFSAFIRDITERKEIEAQKERLLAEIEGVNQELRDFAYIISHDLKAPLRSIGSLSDWLIQDYTDVLDVQGKDLLKLLKGRIGRMYGLIEGVLQYSKIGRLKDEREKVDINVLLNEVIDLLDPPKSCRINLDTNMPIVSYDKTRLQQVFQNLLSNAIKFLDKPKSSIKVIYSKDSMFHIFTIQDNGSGIEEKHFDKIFKIFQTLKTKDRFESTGIGLSIVKRIVELNGGAITVWSKEGEGSSFSFTIPIEN